MEIKILGKELLEMLKDKLSGENNDVIVRVKKLKVHCSAYVNLEKKVSENKYWKEYIFTPENGDGPTIELELEVEQCARKARW